MNEMNTPKKVGCLLCGFSTSEIKEIENFLVDGCDCKEETKAFDYEGTISFTTDKKLTQEQLNQLIDIITLQIVEPVDENQEDEDYSTRNVEVTVKEVI